MSIVTSLFGPGSAIATIVPWLPLMLSGFALNLVISALSMAIGMVFGIFVGAAQSAKVRWLRAPAQVMTLLFRNSPWLVIMFYVMFLMPFEITIGHTYFDFPDWIKAVLALAIPVTGYTSEIVRGGLASVPTTQWEAAASLAYGPMRSLASIILPQAVRLMIPPSVNLYCAVTMATSLANVVGVQEVMTVTQNVLSTEVRPGLILPAYGVTLLFFFAYVFPISLFSRWLERRWTIGSKP